MTLTTSLSASDRVLIASAIGALLVIGMLAATTLRPVVGVF
jgi:phosphoribosylcarboxyaminoimidazole (NCAIR) mutase